MNKRITSLFLSVVMICSLLVTAVPAWAAPGDSGVTATVSQAAPGDTFSVTLKVPGTERLISDMSLKVHFDSAVFEVTEYTIPSIPGMDKMQSNVEEANRNAFFSATYDSETSDADVSFTDGIELTAHFKVKADAPLGDSVFKLDNGIKVSSLTDMGWPDILVTYDDFVNKSATIKVVGAPKPAESISLNKTNLTLTAGEAETLVATVTPSDTTDTVAWSSNKPEVATVDPTTGEVTAVAPGEATITAKAGSVSATCTVKVSCAHNLQTVPAKESNCTDKGWDEYQECTICGALFDMSGGSIEGIPYRPLNNDHDFNMGEWGYKGADGHAHVCTRNPAHKDGVVAHTSSGPATEDTAETCTVCGYEIAPATGHVCASHLTKVEEKLADCTNPGNIEHYKCFCGKLYEDATAAVELTEDQVKRDALGHDWIDATCTEPKTCDRCGETEGTALGHNWATEWSSNADNHWHACTRCDAKNDEVAHTPDRTEATETDPIKCTVCGYVIESATGHVCANHLIKVEENPADCTNSGNIEHYKCSGDTGCGKLYEDRTASVPLTEEQVKLNALGHDWATEWSSNADNHWHACSRCDAKDGEGAHNPGAPATETTPQTCTDCGYVIESATGHLCINHLVEVPKVPATCTTTGTKAHYRCTDPECGKLYWDDDTHDPIEDRSELVIDVLEHDWADEWKSDEHNHWHACKDCDAKTDEAAHSPDHPDGATFEYPVLCVECHYEMEAQLEEGTIRVELPFKLTVEKTGELDPGKEIFKFMAEEFGAPVEYELITSTLETNGAKTYDGIFIFTIMEGDAGNLSEGFVFRQVKGDAEGWTYDETKFYAVPIYNENGDGVEFWNIYYLDEEGMPDEDNRPNGVSFTNSYNAKKPALPSEPSEPSTPDDSSTPQTGDNGNLALWIVLLIASGSATGITLFSKKRKMNAK